MPHKLEEFEIVDIKCKRNNSYARSKDGKHWIWGRNAVGECSLDTLVQHMAYGENRRMYPFRIDKIFYKLTNAVIKEVYLGFKVTYIVGIKQ